MKHPHRFSKRLDPPSEAAIETFSDLLADAQDLEDTSMTALQFALETLGREAGLLVAQTLSEKEPACIAQYNLPENWKVQLTDPDSPLRCVIHDVLESGQYFINEIAAGQPYLDGLAAAIPIPTRSGVQGVLILYGVPCSPVDLDWLQQLSRRIGRAIRSRRANIVKSSSRRSAYEPGEYWKIIQTSTSSLEAEKIQRQLILGLRKMLNAEQCVLVLLDDEIEERITRKILDEQVDSIDFTVVPPKSDPIGGSSSPAPAARPGLLWECIQNQQALFVNDLAANPRFDPDVDSLPGLQARSLLVVPLLVEGRVIGAIQAYNKQSGEFDRADQEAVALVAHFASQAIYDKQLLKQLAFAVGDRELDTLESINTRSMLKALIDNLPGCLYVIDRKYGLVLWNTATAQRLEKQPESLTGMCCYQALYQRSDVCPECLVAETLSKGKETLRNATRLQKNSLDMIATWEVHSYPILDCDDQIIHAILFEQDISERRELEAAVAQSGKLAALGQLAAGVAHEINNPLTAIIANAQILQRELPPGDERLESVDLIALAGARAAQVVRNLLDFARKEQTQRIRTDVNGTLRSALALVQHEIVSRSITLHFIPEDPLPLIMAAPDSLQGVWLNLLLNAVEAVNKNQGVIVVKSWRSSEDVHVSIADNGRGIPTERLDRIFEPFYTTKAPGRGTGLGLSVCRQVVEQHNGQISVNSQMGTGSEFTVTLPIP